MVILGEKSITDVLEKKGKVKIGIQAIVEVDKDNRKEEKQYHFYMIEEYFIHKEEIRYIDNLERFGIYHIPIEEFEQIKTLEDSEEYYKKIISLILQESLERCVNVINNKKMIVAQGRGIATEKIKELQKIVNLH